MLFSPIIIIGQCEHPDFAGLMELYNATNGDGWNKNDGWKQASEGTACSPCDYNGRAWEFLTCTGGRVTRISFTFNNLQGTIPEIALGELEEIRIVDNMGLQDLPKFINTPKLKKIEINKCGISRMIPDFKEVKSLEYLDLVDNRYFGHIPNYDLPNLEVLWLTSNELSGEIPRFEKLLKLEKLNLRNNELVGPVPNFNFPVARNINVSSNQLSGNLPGFENLPEMTIFDCSVNAIEGPCHNFSFNPKMVNLNLISNKFSGPVPDFKDHPNLTKLVLFGMDNDFSGCYPESVCDLAGMSFNNNLKLPFRGEFQKYVMELLM